MSKIDPLFCIVVPIQQWQYSHCYAGLLHFSYCRMDEDSDAVDSDTALDNQLADMKAEELKNKKR